MKHYRKSFFAATVFFTIFTFGIVAALLFLDRDTRAYSACQLNLPSGQVTMTVDVHEYEACGTIQTFNSYLGAALSNVPSGYSVSNGTYDSSCSDLSGYILDNPMFGDPVYQVQLLSSLDNPQFPGRPEISWNKINYILNNTSQYNWLDVQAAIWKLIYTSYPGTFPQGCNGIVNQTNVDNIIADANTNGNGFTPVNGDRFAIVINPQSCTGASPGYVSYCDTPEHPFQILFTATTCVGTYTVTPSAGAGGSINPSTPQTVNHNETTSFTVTPDTGYHIASVTGCSGTLVDTTYTTGPITGDCTVAAAFAIDTHTVTPSAGAGGNIAPSTPQTVDHNATASFTVTPNAGYHTVMSGTCGGNLVGNTYTTNPVTADCTVVASFVIDTYTVTPSAGAGGSITPSTPQTVNYNATTSFTVTPDAGYQISSVTGCGGTLVDTTYTTGPITANCTVTAAFAINPLTITTSSPLPSGPLDVPYNQTLTATGGISPYSWSVSSGALPNGLGLGGSTGLISGTPSTSGTFSFIIQVTDSAVSSVTKNFSITIDSDNARVEGAPPVGTLTLQEAYDICPDGGTIQAQALVFNENLLFDHNISVKLEGGYDPDYTGNPSFTTIEGSMRVTEGEVVVENITIQ